MTSLGNVTMNILVSINDGEPLAIGQATLDHVPTQEKLTEAFTAFAEILGET